MGKIEFKSACTFKIYSSQQYEFKTMLNYCHKTEEKIHVINLKIFASMSILSPRQMLCYEQEVLTNVQKVYSLIKIQRVSVK